MITLHDFQKVEIRLGRIIEVEDFPQAKKPLYKLKIDFGKELGVKNSAAGLVPLYQKKDLLGKLTLAVVNLSPKKIGPFVSEVLTLGVPDKNGQWILVVPERKTAKLGGRLA